MEGRELLQKGAPEFERLAFTVLAIEASAQHKTKDAIAL